MALTLTIGTLSVRFGQFLDTSYPRSVIQQATVEFSAMGTPAIQGSTFEAKHIWTVNTACDLEQRDLIEAIAYEFDAQRRSFGNHNILLYDNTAPIIERVPRTRALAPGATEQLLGGGAYTRYYAQFYAGITENPKFSKAGKKDFLTLSLTEAIRVPA